MYQYRIAFMNQETFYAVINGVCNCKHFCFTRANNVKRIKSTSCFPTPPAGYPKTIACGTGAAAITGISHHSNKH
nr:MAG TPA: hypothetical protein [Caudoviricetes sp.]